MIVIQTILISLLLSCCIAEQYKIDDNGGMGRMFDGIGGLSGGGATSKLLPNYPEPQKTQILDYLFKPNFGASLQILKVEIGGDSQSTDGTEASHMHNEWEENYSRGYEWWLMTEAKKRNPDIKLYGLPWAFPGWVGKGSGSPYKYPKITSDYITKWILAAKKYYNLTIDYVGIWNERPYDRDYIVTLRNTLNKNNLKHVLIVAPDGNWDIAKDTSKNSTLKRSMYAIGAHYPGTVSTTEAQKSGLQLWSSEDFSTFNDNVGAGCWARILNQNYVNGYMTSTISWNLIAAYYNNLPFARCALMTAIEPWSGHYVVESPIWITAHTTQFTQIGWTYLKHGFGSGKLSKGGSYVSLLSPDKKEFTMVIETMSHDHSICIRPALPKYNVSSQTATFKLNGSLAQFNTLQVWYSKLGFDGGNTTLMKKQEDVKIIGGSFTLQLVPDTVYTLSTVATATKGQLPAPPQSKPLGLPYFDNFDKYPEHSEAFNFVPQAGSFEIMNSSDASRGMVNRQTVQADPINWCSQNNRKPITLGGNFEWSDVKVSVDVYVPGANGTTAVFLAARVDKGGCDTEKARGIFLWMYPGNKTFVLTADLAQTLVVNKGTVPIAVNSWFTISFATKGNQVLLDVADQTKLVDLPSATMAAAASGFIAYGTHDFGIADFDNLKVENPSSLFAPEKSFYSDTNMIERYQHL